MKVIQFKQSGRFVVDAQPTGFKSTLRKSKATRFVDLDTAQAFVKDRGILCEVQFLEASLGVIPRDEYAALLAVAEAAEKLLRADIGEKDLRKALNRLADVRGGKVVES